MLGPDKQPGIFNSKIILQGFPSAHKAYKALANLKHAVRERIGFLQWYPAAVPEWETTLTPQPHNDVL
jgi:hypothetical protein